LDKRLARKSYFDAIDVEYKAKACWPRAGSFENAS